MNEHTHCWHEYVTDAEGRVVASYLAFASPSAKMRCCVCKEVRDRPEGLAVFSAWSDGA